MASQIIHALEGFAALADASPDFAKTLRETTLEWFYLGCQGPDIFYHSQRTAPYGVYYGGLLHRSKFREAAIALLGVKLQSNLQPDNPLHAFILGFLTHGWIDSLTHPYVVYHAGWYEPATPESAEYRHAHTFLERILDSLYWEETQGQSVAAFEQERSFIPSGAFSVIPGAAGTAGPESRVEFSTVLESVMQALITALSEVYGPRFLRFADPAARMRNAFRDAFHVFTKTDPSGLPKGERAARLQHLPEAAKAMLFPERPDPRVDWENKEHRVWRHPCLPERSLNGSWLELLEEARHRNTELLSAALAVQKAGKGSESKQQQLVTLLPAGTLNVGNAEGRQEKAVFSDPLPVHKELLRLASS